MKILYLLYSFTTGGTEKLLVNICNEMVKNKHQISLYIFNNHYDKYLIDSLDSRVNVIYGNRKKGSKDKIKHLLKLIFFLKKNKFDIIHCNSVNTLELLAFKSIFFKKTKVFYTIHAMNTFTNKSKKRIHYYNRKCDKFIAISNVVKQNAITSGIKENKINVIYNAIDFSVFDESNKIFNPHDIKIGIVARIVPEIKGQDILINAIAKLKNKYNLKCYFAGEPPVGKEKTLDELKDLSEKLGVKDNCIFLGNVKDINEFLNKIDIFVLPSRHEGFGLSLLEAIACGIPCVSSNVDGPSELSENGKLFLLFENNNYNDLCLKIENMIENYSYFKDNVRLINEYVKEKYNIKKMCLELIENYK